MACLNCASPTGRGALPPKNGMPARGSSRSASTIGTSRSRCNTDPSPINTSSPPDNETIQISPKITTTIATIDPRQEAKKLLKKFIEYFFRFQKYAILIRIKKYVCDAMINQSVYLLIGSN